MTEKELYQSTASLLQILFSLPEIRHISIKGISIPSYEATQEIWQGITLSYHDKFSDVDIKTEVLVTPEEFLCPAPYFQRHFSRLQLGEQVLGCSFSARSLSPSSAADTTEVVRLCLNSGFRADLICMLQKAETERELSQLSAGPAHEAVQIQRDARADNFWFIAVQALGKLYRRDYLIADHLTHMLLMEGLVLQMEARDRQLNTNIHRYGHREPLAYRELKQDAEEHRLVNSWIKDQDETFQFIAVRIHRAVTAYEHLKGADCPGWISRKASFLNIWKSYV